MCRRASGLKLQGLKPPYDSLRAFLAIWEYGLSFPFHSLSNCTLEPASMDSPPRHKCINRRPSYCPSRPHMGWQALFWFLLLLYPRHRLHRPQCLVDPKVLGASPPSHLAHQPLCPTVRVQYQLKTDQVEFYLTHSKPPRFSAAAAHVSRLQPTMPCRLLRVPNVQSRRHCQPLPRSPTTWSTSTHRPFKLQLPLPPLPSSSTPPFMHVSSQRAPSYVRPLIPNAADTNTNSSSGKNNLDNTGRCINAACALNTVAGSSSNSKHLDIPDSSRTDPTLLIRELGYMSYVGMAH